MLVVELLQSSPVTYLIVVAILGLMVGSFLNVVIYRLPLIMEHHWKQECQALLHPDATPDESDKPFSLAKPRSHCPSCKHTVSAVQNIPVISYLILKGRCANCGAKISLRYPIIEMLSAIMAVTVAWHFGFSWQAGAALLFTWALIALTFIDVDHQLLPDNITLPLLWLGLLISLGNVFVDPVTSIIGAAAGYLLLWGVYHLFKLLTRKEGMGYGDFKLLAVLGAWAGWQQLPVIIILSSLVGAVVGISLIVLRRHQRGTPIPFGPYLAAAGWIALLWGESLTEAYLTRAGIY